MQLADEVIFSQGNVVVSRALVRVGSDTYSVAGIGSVFIRPARKTLHVLVGMLMAMIAIYFLLDVGNDSGNLGIGLFFIALSLIFFIWAGLLPSRLFLRTASGDHPVLMDRRVAFLQQIKAGIEQALISRS